MDPSPALSFTPAPPEAPPSWNAADQAKNQLASDWMHEGIDLLGEGSAPALERAVRCFDQAIALRRTLPLEEILFLRYGLSAGWINRGDALARLEEGRLAEAVRSYDEALALLESLPLEENVLYPRRLAIAWINRGTALRRQTAGDAGEAARSFRAALAVLDHPAASAIADARALRAGAWINLADVLADGGGGTGAEALAAARAGLALAEPAERADLSLAEVSFKARHFLGRRVVQALAERRPAAPNLLAAAIQAVEGTVRLAGHWHRKGQPGFAGLAREIFRFGCRIHQDSPPRVLAQFLEASFTEETVGAMLAGDPACAAAARAALWSSLAHLQAEGFRFVGTPAFAPFLADIQTLREAEERLR
jgi:tetratricopeptide (TPR) repeat protein